MSTPITDAATAAIAALDAVTPVNQAVTDSLNALRTMHNQTMSAVNSCFAMKPSTAAYTAAVAQVRKAIADFDVAIDAMASDIAGAVAVSGG
jgi:hypothetical protein